jgi:HSP20 family protein
MLEKTMYTSTRHATLSSLDGLLNDLFRPAADPAPAPLALRVDVRETPEAYTLHAELPGVKRDDIQVEIDGDEVSIVAEVKREAEPAEGERWLRRERAAGKAARRFVLPSEVDQGTAVAKFADGVLMLTLPKKAPAASRRIAVS